MEFAILALLGMLGAALIAGGAYAYRASVRVGVRTFAVAAIASGVIVWALLVYIAPVAVISGS